MIRGHKEGCRCDACFELMLEDVRQAQREVAVILGDAPARSEDAVTTRERALEEALRTTANDDDEARATIAELEKRIESLLNDNGEVALMHIRAEQALTAERQRRKDAEAALERLDTNGDSDIGRKLSRAYFARYPS